MIGLTLAFIEDGKETSRNKFSVPSLPEIYDEIVVDGYAWEILELYLNFKVGQEYTEWVAEVVPAEEGDTEDDPDGLELPVPEGDNVLTFARKVA